MSDPRPIGIFDSGVGGLTVARALRERLPNESFIYYGDSARLPYGNKPAELVVAYSMENVAFLESKGVKLIVIACNTASALALGALREATALPLVGVVLPGAERAVAATRNGRIALIATKGTVASGAYEEAIRNLAPSVELFCKPCPLFVPLVEEGLYTHPATRLFAEEYLSSVKEFGADTLLLGCTHYPYLAPLIQEVVGQQVHLVDSASATASAVVRLLEEEGLATSYAGSGSYEEYFSSSFMPPRQAPALQQLRGFPAAQCQW